MRVFIDTPDIKYSNNTTNYTISVAGNAISKAKSLIKDGFYLEALKTIPYGTQIIIDGKLFYKYEDDYGFNGTCAYYKSDNVVYRNEHQHLVEILTNAKKSVRLRFIGNNYKRSPLFT